MTRPTFKFKCAIALALAGLLASSSALADTGFQFRIPFTPSGAVVDPTSGWAVTGSPPTSFVPTTLGNFSATDLAVSVRNAGTAVASLAIPAFAGAHAGDFSASGCANVSAGASCTVTVRFKPSAPGPREASLLLAGQSYAFSGTGARLSAVDYLVVAGGGGGGRFEGGGGGGGGVISGSGYAVGTQPYTITVGAGGRGQLSNTQPIVSNGGNSVFASFNAVGGGGGGGYNQGATNFSGASGGSGGGSFATAAAGSGTSGQGFSGAAGISVGAWSETSGGGGGAGGSGQLGTWTASGAGGAGVSSGISGTVVYYGAGGGGAAPSSGSAAGSAGAGGLGGGGAGGRPSALDGGAGTPGTGSGGGGGAISGQPGVAGVAGDGGSGVVILRYQGVPAATGGAITSVGGYTIHTFTSSGTFTVQ